jgi:hypothetical protein
LQQQLVLHSVRNLFFRRPAQSASPKKTPSRAGDCDESIRVDTKKPPDVLRARGHFSEFRGSGAAGFVRAFVGYVRTGRTRNRTDRAHHTANTTERFVRNRSEPVSSARAFRGVSRRSIYISNLQTQHHHPRAVEKRRE